MWRGQEPPLPPPPPPPPDPSHQVAANEAANKKFPLAHRCLEGREWKLVNQLESVALSSHESVMLMQKQQGVDPGIVFLLALGCRNVNKSTKVQLVSGAEGKEVWKEVHEASLDSMWRKYRSIMVAQLEKRFNLNGHPGKDVLLCLKMNPLVNTSSSAAPLFEGKSSVYELMEGEYMHVLKRRSMTIAGPSSSSAPAPAPTPKDSPAPNDSAIQQPKKKARKSLSVMGGLTEYNLSSAPNTTAIEDRISAEIAKFESIKVALAAANDQKYVDSGIFNAISFWNDHRKVLPIHAKVFCGDTGPMKGASSNVESIFSGVKRLLGDFAATMSPEILEMYVFIHYNMQYEFMRPTIEEIVEAYLKLYGAEARAEDIDDGESDEDEDGEDDADDADDDAGVAVAVAGAAAPAGADANAGPHQLSAEERARIQAISLAVGMFPRDCRAWGCC